MHYTHTKKNADMTTSDQIKRRLRTEGKTISSWAKANKFPRQEVYRVLNGQSKAYYGQAHRIAVALGLKAASA